MSNQLARTIQTSSGPSFLRSIRNVRRLTGDPLAFFTELMAAHPGESVIPFARLGRRRVVFIADPSVASQVLTSKNFGLAEILMSTLAKYFGRKGPFSTEGNDWQTGHDLTAPLFRRDEVLVGQKAQIINDLLRHFVDTLQSAAAQPPVNILALAKDTTIRMACEVVIGADLTDKEIAECGEDIESLVLWVFQSMNNPLLFASFSRRRQVSKTRQRLHDLIRRMISSPPPDKGFLTALSLLWEKRHSGEISAEMFFSIILQLITAGHETTASSIAWLCRYLATDGTGVYITQALRDEASKLLSLPPDKAWTHKDFPGLTNVVNEVLLRYPPIISVFRAASCDTTLTDGAGQEVFFTQGTLIYVPILVLNHERYASQDTSGNPFAGFTFSKGRRSCPGGPLAIRTLLTLLALLIDRNIGFKVAAEDGHIAHLAYKPQGLKLQVIQL